MASDYGTYFVADAYRHPDNVATDTLFTHAAALGQYYFQCNSAGVSCDVVTAGAAAGLARRTEHATNQDLDSDTYLDTNMISSS